MNWKIILQLSAFGLIMAFGTISLIPQNVEPVFWLIIFAFSAWLIAKVCTAKYFLHGFLVSLVNCFWITAVHIILRETYMAHHPQLASMNANLPPTLQDHPRLAMLSMGPIFGIISGLILGLFAFIASKLVKKA
jgi:hypothetical protein